MLFITICNIYIILILLWYFFPTGIVNLKYSVVDGVEIRDNPSNRGKLFIVDHRENPFVDILIMSNECRKMENINYLVSAGSERANIINYLPKITPYKVINITKGNTVQKCIDLINDNKNIIIFISNEVSKRTGIYYILKETNANAIIVKKKIENIKFIGWEDRILDVVGKRQEIKYIDYKYNLSLSPSVFMKNVIAVLFS
tara:strand:- start:1054 stop:1656 length:603 start_codon:yes stop_codon:yes gene_type:complete